MLFELKLYHSSKRKNNYSFLEKLIAGRHLFPVVGLIVCVLGSIYGGYATPTEAATIGVCGACYWPGLTKF